eukprot:4603611-Amphidinium_carterae.1
MYKWAWERRLYLAHILPSTALGEAWAQTSLSLKKRSTCHLGWLTPGTKLPSQTTDDSVLDL